MRECLPAEIEDLAIIGAEHFAKGARTKAALSERLIKEFGDGIKPNLEKIFARAETLHTLSERAFNGKSLLTNEERYARGLESDKKRIATLTERLRAKTEAGEFGPAPKKPPRMDKEKEDLLFEYHKVKERYNEGLIEAKRAKRTTWQKLKGMGQESVNLSRAMLTSFDFPPIFRQGAFITYGQSPMKTARAARKAFEAIFSEKAQFRINEEIRNSENARLYNRDKLQLTEIGPNTSLARMEENFMSRWIHKLPSWTIVGPILRGSARGYGTLLNVLRAEKYDTMTATLSRTGVPTPKEGAAIASFINNATGRGSLGGMEKSAASLNTLFFAPRLYTSRFALLTGQPLRGGTARTKKLIAKEYGKTLIGLGSVYALGMAAGGEVEWDPRSSDFGKIRFGNTRIDPLFGLSQITVFLSRLGTGETKRGDGSIQPLRTSMRPLNLFRSRPDRRKGNDRLMIGLITSHIRSKLAPAPGKTVDVIVEKDVTGQPVTPQSAALDMVTPINLGDIVDAMEEQGMARGAALAFVSQWGMSLQTYEQRKKR